MNTSKNQTAPLSRSTNGAFHTASSLATAYRMFMRRWKGKNDSETLPNGDSTAVLRNDTGNRPIGDSTVAPRKGTEPQPNRDSAPVLRNGTESRPDGDNAPVLRNDRETQPIGDSAATPMNGTENQPNRNSSAVLKNGRENRSPRTIQSYKSQAKPFIDAYREWRDRYIAERGPFAHTAPYSSPYYWCVFPKWFALTFRDTPWCKQTLTMVKISLIYVLGGMLGEQGIEDIRSFKPNTVQETGIAGIALHEKNPSPQQIQGILSFLDRHGTLVASLAAAWFRAELVTGLRPKEWAHVRYKEEGLEGTLTIINGKQNGMLCQGTGISRQLVFRGPEFELERHILREFFLLKDEYYRQFRENKGYTDDKCFTRMLRNCQEVYRTANDALRQGRPVSLEEKNITLYSLRNAFKADAFNLAKPGPERRLAIAALMGHSSLASQDMYAPENRATGRMRMPASPGRLQQPVSESGTISQDESYARDRDIPAEYCNQDVPSQTFGPYPV